MPRQISTRDVAQAKPVGGLSTIFELAWVMITNHVVFFIARLMDCTYPGFALKRKCAGHDHDAA